MKTKVKFASPETTGALVSQFYLALEKCFEMKLGEFVLIEKDGDVSKLNPTSSNDSEQIELKEFAEDNDLTDSHLNFWNTLKNWINPDFDPIKYKFLILATTQEIGVKSMLLKWNESNKKERLEILKEIYSKAKGRSIKSQIKNPDAKESDSLKLMNEVFKEKEKLEIIIEKIFIDNNRTRRDKIVDEIIEKYLKPFPSTNQEIVLKSILGYVIKEEEYNKGWEISYYGFKQEIEDLSGKFNNETKLFPVREELKTIPKTEREKTKRYAFVKKIEDIQYDEVILKSLNDYWFTLNTIAQEFKGRKQKEISINNFEENLITVHNAEHRISSRNCSSLNLINDSKNFYDKITGSQVPGFDIYSDTPLVFRNGMYHILANEDDNKVVWKLNSKKVE
jgi:hypothetical protein